MIMFLQNINLFFKLSNSTILWLIIFLEHQTASSFILFLPRSNHVLMSYEFFLSLQLLHILSKAF